ncbi:hypothetical protein vseg_007964 [Gypsophila vaccaria]
MVSVSSDNHLRKKRTSKGKQKITIKKIEDKDSRQVSFTKRRNGLFKKLSEFCSKYDSEFAAITFSIAGKPITNGYPCAEAVIRRFSESNQDNRTRCFNWWDNPVTDLGLDDLVRFKAELQGLRGQVIYRFNQISRFNNAEILGHG